MSPAYYLRAHWLERVSGHGGRGGECHILFSAIGWSTDALEAKKMEGVERKEGGLLN